MVKALACHVRDRGFKPRTLRHIGGMMNFIEALQECRKGKVMSTVKSSELETRTTFIKLEGEELFYKNDGPQAEWGNVTNGALPAAVFIADWTEVTEVVKTEDVNLPTMDSDDYEKPCHGDQGKEDRPDNKRCWGIGKDS